MQSDKSGLYIDPVVGAGKFSTLDENKIVATGEKLKGVISKLNSNNVYFGLIPNKAEYGEKYYPGTDFELIKELIEDTVSQPVHIDVANSITGEMYYKTDLHWNQPKLTGVAMTLAKAMGFSMEKEFEIRKEGKFTGVYEGQLAIELPPDDFEYLMSDKIKNSRLSVIDEKTWEWIQAEIYDFAALDGPDPYNFFLKGTQPLVKLETGEMGKKLFIFRDSFASSLAPLLLGGYSEIVLIDLRYVDFRILDNFINIGTDDDVLFLYSTEILDKPEIFLTGDF